MLQETIEENIVIMTIANGKTNPITKEILEQIAGIVKKVNDSETLKGIIFTGEGRFFSSGFDLPMFLSFKDLPDAVSFFEFEERILLDYFNCSKPIVCAMNGHSAAAGLIFAMASDYRIIKNHPKIKVGMSEIKIGLPLSIAQNEIVRFGLDTDKKFRNVMYFGEMMDVNKAAEMGIVDEVVEEEALINRAKEIVKLWIDTPNKPFMRMKKLLKKPVTQRIETWLKEENWQDELNCFFKEDVRQTLEFVQASMG